MTGEETINEGDRVRRREWAKSFRNGGEHKLVKLTNTGALNDYMQVLAKRIRQNFQDLLNWLQLLNAFDAIL
jgi:hypothetical protein